MSAWRDIASAPRDGTEIDVWAVSAQRPAGLRIPDAAWDSFCDDWLCLDWSGDAAPDDKYLSFWGWTVTHWMPIPAPPVSA